MEFLVGHWCLYTLIVNKEGLQPHKNGYILELKLIFPPSFLHAFTVYLHTHVHAHACTIFLIMAILLMLTSLLQSGIGGRGFSLTGPHTGSVTSSLPFKSKTCYTKDMKGPCVCFHVLCVCIHKCSSCLSHFVYCCVVQAQFAWHAGILHGQNKSSV